MLVCLKDYAKIHDLGYSNVRAQVANGHIPVVKRDSRYTWVDSDFVYHSKSNYVRKIGAQRRLSSILCAVRRRCNNPNFTYYHRYGGRGIKVCKEWQESTSAFIEWALSHGYADNLTLDRIDNDGDYCPENCQWITQSENAHKRKLDNEKARMKAHK